MKITNTCSYAISALTRLAAAGANAQISNAELCKGTELPPRYVLQLLRELVTRGVIVSQRGVQGGYRLARPASKITLLEIVEAIDGPVGGIEPITIEGMAPASIGKVTKTLAAVAEDTRRRLAAISLADLRAAKAA